LIPPLIASEDNEPESISARSLIKRIELNVSEAQDNLLAAKILQSEFANRHRADEPSYQPGDKFMLFTENRRCEYMQRHSGRSAKFMPQFDGPFVVTKTNPSKSAYTLDLPNEPDRFATFHASELRKFVPNDDDKFPARKLSHPGLVMTPDGEEEWLIDRILDERVQGRGRRFLVRWHGWGPEEDRWLPGSKLADTEALDNWLNN
jgi:Chromo (CHRromatin Organisation MOdifier) domain